MLQIFATTFGTNDQGFMEKIQSLVISWDDLTESNSSLIDVHTKPVMPSKDVKKAVNLIFNTIQMKRLWY